MSAEPASIATLPRLEMGDHLPPDKFMRRYEARPDIKKAELEQGTGGSGTA
jgi:hypothetical protein